MSDTLQVVLIEKLADGEMREIEERAWSSQMIIALEHANYIIVGGREYQTLEGRLNIDTGKFELLLVVMPEA
ncbi:hypothetical protein J2Z69_002528 [Paenibacillus shirakamiensis]|uniref:Uncharacterized protein n=1 Tax=Paenibacillus shirakamiensis TaxID=1265935 RepID=A0ABS4JIE5_9BACL|nr:hypothetical protein [Paenibacillus shirakamiensis]MBP2001483.1 hypothetical protein [Paenibacillus shirakamiensis]